MCYPAVAAIATVLSTGVSIYSAQQHANYNNQVAENNATVAEYQAKDAIERGELEEKQARLKAEQLKGQQRAAIAGSGFTLSEGSASDVLEDTAALAEADIYNIRSNAAREAWAYRVQASNSRAQGQLALASGRTQSATSLLEGTGSVASKWYRYRRGG